MTKEKYRLWADQNWNGDRIKAAVDFGGGQTCDVEGVLRALDEAGYVIVPRPAKRASRVAGELPDDWQPNRDYARGKGMTDRQIDREAERFCDHARAKGCRYKNWDAAWRNWVTSPYQQTNGNGGRQSNGTSLMDAFGRLQERLGAGEVDYEPSPNPIFRLPSR